MAEALTPGASKRAEENAKKAKQKYILTLRGEEFELNIGNLPMSERIIVRKGVGVSLDDLLSSFGLETIVTIWWLARRGKGETQLTFKRAADEWASQYGDLDEDDLELHLDDGMDDGLSEDELAEKLADDPEG